MFGWFDAKEAKQFGAALAESYVAQLPPTANLNEKKFAATTQSILRSMDTKIDAFKVAHRLNGYRKAQLGNTFKWALKDAGYAPEYIDKLTDWLMTRL